ncbi:Hypothetical protein, putative, partial [Bodo saltans]
MGKKATFIKARLHEFHRKKVSRGKRSEEIRKKRLGEDSNRLVQRVLSKRPLPVQEDQELLLKQFGQSCRLPTPADDLVNLVKSLQEEGGRADAAKAVAENMITLAKTDVSLFQSLLVDENASRVISVSVSSTEAPKLFASVHKQLCATIFAAFEAAPALIRHHVSSRVFSALVVGNSSVDLSKIVKLLGETISNYDDALAIVKDRHIAPIICRLLSLPGTEVAEWLSVLLKITPAAEKPLKRAKKDAAVQDNTTLTPESLGSVISSIIDDPIAAPVLHALITDSNRWSIFSALILLPSSTTKRSQRFLIRLLEVGGEGPSAVATQLLDSILLGSGSELIGSIVDSSFDSNLNFTVQKVIQLLPRVNDRASVFHRRILELVSSRLFDMSTHGIAVHVVVTLIDASHALGEKGKYVGAVADSICRPENVMDLLRNSNGSLVVRKMIETSSHGASSSLLMTTVEQHMSSLIYDSTGNLIVQQLLRSGNPSTSSAFFRRYLKGEALLSAAQHAGAAHVVHTLFDCVDPPTFAEMCGILKPQCCNLARHLNGRFVVEKMIPSQKDVRDSLVRQFIPLAMAKGTQHLLVLLFEHLDNSSKTALLQNVVQPHFRQLATNGTSSIVLQKLLQGSPF